MRGARDLIWLLTASGALRLDLAIDAGHTAIAGQRRF